MITAIVFIIILGLLVFIHEMGHFWVARRNGIKADEFGFGFPPRAFGFVKDDASGKYKFIKGNERVESKNTVFSVNWIPLGGFVKIKGEGGEGSNDPDSFASRSAWTRIKVLAAGVIMNFVLAWFLISLTLMIGSPKEVAEGTPGAEVRISGVLANSPAAEMGIREMDIISGICVAGDCVKIDKGSDLQRIIGEQKGKEIVLKVERGKNTVELKGSPRLEFPAGEAPLGISFFHTINTRLPIHEALYRGLTTIFRFFAVIFGMIGSLIIGKKVAVDAVGPIGIIFYTKQVTELGLVYILQFAGILSINLGIINILPIPALDGGRILFILIEKLKGSPVSQRIENGFHTVGFTLLIGLMILITVRDFMKFDIIGRIMNLF